MLVAANALLASSVLLKGGKERRNFAFGGILLMFFGVGGLFIYAESANHNSDRDAGAAESRRDCG